METRNQLKGRLQAAGLWAHYVALRDRLKSDGRTPSEARAEALREVEAQRAAPNEQSGGEPELNHPPLCPSCARYWPICIRP